jgi:AcrR family transcriptional regulator
MLDDRSGGSRTGRMAPRRDAREQMILAAERLFAERGIGAVSLREIGAAAGQRNNGAAQYHFGTKRGLVDAIVALRMAPIDRRRQAFLAELDAAGRGGELRAMVEALVLPFADFVAGHETHWARFLAQVAAEPDLGLRGLVERPETRGLRKVTRRLEAALGILPPRVRRHRLELAQTLVLHAGSAWERAAAGGAGGPRAHAPLARDLVDAIVGLLAAPATPPMPASPRRPRGDGLTRLRQST